MAKKPKKEATPATVGVEGESAPKKKFPPKMMLIAGAGALVVLGGGGAAATMLLGGKKKDEAAAAHGGEHKTSGIVIKKHGAEKGGEHAKGGDEEKNAATLAEGPDGVAFYTLPDMVVNIQSADSRPTFLKLKLAFEVTDQATVDALEPNRPRLTDMFTAFLRELRPEDLAGSAGSWALRQEIQRRVNLVIAPTKIKAVLIQEMLVQ